MKKAINATTFVALALAASVTYNIVQHQRAKGIRPESQTPEDSTVQSAENIDAPEAAGAATATTPAAGTISAVKPASAVQQKSDITFRSATYNRYSDVLHINFNTPSYLQPKLPKNAIEITPAVDHVSAYTSASLIAVNGGFKPGISYRVRVKKGLMDVSGKATLENDAVFDITIPELRENFSFLTRGSVFPLHTESRRITFPYSARNLNKFKVNVYRAFDNNMNFSEGR